MNFLSTCDSLALKSNETVADVEFFDISEPLTLLERKDNFSIVKSSSCFFALFAKIYRELEIDNYPLFTVVQTNARLQFCCNKSTQQEVTNAIETIRQIFLESFKKQASVTIAQLEADNEYYFVESSPRMINLQDKQGIDAKKFDNIVRPCLVKLFQTLGGTCQETTVLQSFSSSRLSKELKSCGEEPAFSISFTV